MKKTRKILLIALAVLTITIVGYLIYQAYKQPKPTTPQAPPFMSKFYPEIKAKFQKVQKKYNGKLLETNNSSIWWISSDNLNIINEGSPGIGLYAFNCEEDIPSRSTFKKIAQLLKSEIDEVMKQNGFNPNSKNSSESIEDDQFYDYIQAYENNDIKCILKASPDCVRDSQAPMHYAYSFACTDNFTKNYQKQAPYLKDLNIDNAIIHIQNKTQNFVRLSVHRRRTGYYLIAKKVNGDWQKIISGQEAPSCKLVEKHQVPEKIAPNCTSYP